MRWWSGATWGERAIPIVLVALLVGSGVFVVKAVGGLVEQDPPFSLCPDDRSSAQVVRGSQVIEEAAAYAGPGPHPLYVDGPSYATDALPDEWIVPREDNGRYRVGQLQLVVCEYVYAVDDEGDLQTCPYTPIGGGPTATFTTQSAKYDYQVYEAATGTQLAAFTIVGVTRPCADIRTIYGDGEQHSEHPAYPDYQELERKLKPLVDP